MRKYNIRNRRRNGGFSIAELLVVVAILVILAGVSFVAGTSMIRNTRQTHLDKRAEAIYYAAQSRMMELYVSKKGEDADTNSLAVLQKNTCMTTNPEDGSQKLCVIKSAGTDAATAYFLKDNSMSEELSGGSSNWIIEYDPISLGVYSVTFSEKTGDKSAISNYSESSSNSAIRGDAETRRETYNANIGYYSAGSSFTSAGNDRDDGTLGIHGGAWIINKEDLTGIVRIAMSEKTYQTLSTASAKIKYKIQLKGVNSKKTIELKRSATLEEDGTEATGELNIAQFKKSGSSYFVTLDLILDSLDFDKRFQKLTDKSGNSIVSCGFIPGEDLILAVEIEDVKSDGSGAKGNVRGIILESDPENSLFADFDYNSTTAQGVAKIIYPRHLQNLSEPFSGVRAIGAAEAPAGTNKIAAVLLEDIKWDADKNLYRENKTDAGVVRNFVPITNTELVSFNGLRYSDNTLAMPLGGANTIAAENPEKDNCKTKAEENKYHVISGIAIDSTKPVGGITTDGTAGLFGTVSNFTVASLVLQDFVINNEVAGKPTGTLVGSLGTGSTVKNIYVYNDPAKVATDKIKGAGSTGGLIGEMVSSDINGVVIKNVNVESGAAAGALAGKADNSAGTANEIKNVLAYNGDKHGTDAGGNAVPGTTVNSASFNDDNYEIKGAGSVGGLLGELTGGSLTGSTAALYVKSTGGNAGGLIGTATGAASVSLCQAGGHTTTSTTTKISTDGQYAITYSSDATAAAKGRVNVIGSGAVGGFVGSWSGSSIENCYSTCSASSTANTVGGFVGSATSGTITTSYAVGQVFPATGQYFASAAGGAGGFAGSVSGATLTTNRYMEILNPTTDGDYLKGVSGVSDNGTAVKAIDAVMSSTDTDYEYNSYLVTADKLTIEREGKTHRYNGDIKPFAYELKTATELKGVAAAADLFFVDSHYGDWPVFETQIVNDGVTAKLFSMPLDPFAKIKAFASDLKNTSLVRLLAEAVITEPITAENEAITPDESADEQQATTPDNSADGNNTEGTTPSDETAAGADTAGVDQSGSDQSAAGGQQESAADDQNDGQAAVEGAADQQNADGQQASGTEGNASDGQGTDDNAAGSEQASDQTDANTADGGQTEGGQTSDENNGTSDGGQTSGDGNATTTDGSTTDGTAGDGQTNGTAGDGQANGTTDDQTGDADNQNAASGNDTDGQNSETGSGENDKSGEIATDINSLQDKNNEEIEELIKGLGEKEEEEKDGIAEGTLVAGDRGISISFGKEANIPEGAELEVIDIAEDSEDYDYAQIVSDAVEAMELSMDEVASVKAMDLSIVKDGEEIQPEAPVSVEIKTEQVYENNEVFADDDISAVHMKADEPEVIPTEVSTEIPSETEEAGEGEIPELPEEIAEKVDSLQPGDTDDNPATTEAAKSVTFETDGFSVFVLVQPIQQKQVIATDDSVYCITVDYDNASGIPANAELVVSEIASDTEEYEGYVGDVAETCNTLPEYFEFAHVFDISFVDTETGDQYQPNKMVNVSMQLMQDEVTEESDIAVAHMTDETQLMESTVTESTIAFGTEGFSPYVVAALPVFDVADISLAGKTLSIKSGDKYLALNNTKDGVIAEDTLAENTLWEFELSDDNYRVFQEISAGGTTTKYYLKINGTSLAISTDENDAALLHACEMTKEDDAHHVIFTLDNAGKPAQFIEYDNGWKLRNSVSATTKMYLSEVAVTDSIETTSSYYISYQGHYLSVIGNEIGSVDNPCIDDKWTFVLSGTGYKLKRGKHYVGKDTNGWIATTDATKATVFTVTPDDPSNISFYTIASETNYMGYAAADGYTAIKAATDPGTELFISENLESNLSDTSMDGKEYYILYNRTFCSRGSGKLSTQKVTSRVDRWLFTAVDGGYKISKANQYIKYDNGTWTLVSGANNASVLTVSDMGSYHLLYLANSDLANKYVGYGNDTDMFSKAVAESDATCQLRIFEDVDIEGSYIIYCPTRMLAISSENFNGQAVRRNDVEISIVGGEIKKGNGTDFTEAELNKLVWEITKTDDPLKFNIRNISNGTNQYLNIGNANTSLRMTAEPGDIYFCPDDNGQIRLMSSGGYSINKSKSGGFSSWELVASNAENEWFQLAEVSGTGGTVEYLYPKAQTDKGKPLALPTSDIDRVNSASYKFRTPSDKKKYYYSETDTGIDKYEFDKWQLVGGTATDVYAAGATIPSALLGKNVTLKAVWKKVSSEERPRAKKCYITREGYFLRIENDEIDTRSGSKANGVSSNAAILADICNPAKATLWSFSGVFTQDGTKAYLIHYGDRYIGKNAAGTNWILTDKKNATFFTDTLRGEISEGVEKHLLKSVNKTRNEYIGCKAATSNFNVVHTGINDAEVILIEDTSYSSDKVLYTYRQVNQNRSLQIDDKVVGGKTYRNMLNLNTFTISAEKVITTKEGTNPTVWTLEKNSDSDNPMCYYIKVLDPVSEEYKYISIGSDPVDSEVRNEVTLTDADHKEPLYITIRGDGKLRIGNAAGYALDLTALDSFAGHATNGDNEWFTLATLDKNEIVYKYVFQDENSNTCWHILSDTDQVIDTHDGTVKTSPDMETEYGVGTYALLNADNEALVLVKDGKTISLDFLGWNQKYPPSATPNEVYESGDEVTIPADRPVTIYHAVWGNALDTVLVKYIIEEPTAEKTGNLIDATETRRDNLSDFMKAIDGSGTALKNSREFVKGADALKAYKARNIRNTTETREALYHMYQRIKKGNDYYTYEFKGWKIKDPAVSGNGFIKDGDGADLEIQPGYNVVLNQKNDNGDYIYANEDDEVTLVAQWAYKFDNNEGQYASVNFSIIKDADQPDSLLDGEELTMITEEKDSYAMHVGGTIIHRIVQEKDDNNNTKYKIVLPTDTRTPANYGLKYWMIAPYDKKDDSSNASDVLKADDNVRYSLYSEVHVDDETGIGYVDSDAGHYDNGYMDNYFHKEVQKNKFYGNNYEPDMSTRLNDSKYRYKWQISYIPSDEDVLAKLRNNASLAGQIKIKKKVGDTYVDTPITDLSELTTDNYTIRWYFVKYQGIDFGYHIDGKLTKKQNYIAVTKKFKESGSLNITNSVIAKSTANVNAGDSLETIARKAMKDGFYITLTDQTNHKHVKKLVMYDKTEGNTNTSVGHGMLGGTMDAYGYVRTFNDGDGIRYLWVVPFDEYNSTHTYTIDEHNYDYVSPADENTLYGVNVTYDKIEIVSGGAENITASGSWNPKSSPVSTTSVASDETLDFDKLHRVEFTNTYSSESVLNIKKVDKNGTALKNVEFKVFKDDQTTPSRIYKSTNGLYNLMYEDESFSDIAKTDENGLLRLALPLPDAGKTSVAYTIKETIPAGYPGAGDTVNNGFKITITGDGKMMLKKEDITLKSSYGLIKPSNKNWEDISTPYDNEHKAVTNFFIIVNGGGLEEVSLNKIDGSGKNISGARFALYDTLANAQAGTGAATDTGIVSITVPLSATTEGEAYYATSTAVTDAPNLVFKAPVGTYYMKEVLTPDGCEPDYYVADGADPDVLANHKQCIYRIYVGEEAVTTAVIDIQTDTGKTYTVSTDASNPTKFVAVRLDKALDKIDTDCIKSGKSTIEQYGIINLSKTTGKVVLKKIANYGKPYEGPKFDIWRSDYLSIEKNTTLSWTSGPAGAFYIGKLPVGVYYLHETPIGGKGTDTWFKVEVTKDDSTGITSVSDLQAIGTTSPFTKIP